MSDATEPEVTGGGPVEAGHGAPEVAPVLMPPTLPGEVHAPVTWPTPLSVACFVVGGLGAVVALYGLAAPFISALFVQLDRTGATAASLSAGEKYQWVLFAANLMGLCLAGWLIYAGYLISQRRRSARTQARGYSFCKIVHAFAVVGLNVFVQHQVFESMQGGMPKNTAGLASGILSVGLVIGAIFGIIMYTAMPVVLLIWFGRKSVRAEVARWKPGR
ncbi:MAG: hypothetical protein AB7G11_07055 [Phycisphaerales bacterium]